jgi:NadR type nicotinamide-nucleotide adenylyltransferase
MNVYGLVIGKFYPPHNGHAHLIQEAEKQCDSLFVVVLGTRFESISLEHRVAWLKEEFKNRSNIFIIGQKNDTPEDYNSPEIWKAHVEQMRLALNTRRVRNIDKVFTSEAYGQELADYFEAENVVVDMGRTAHHVSGTACRDEIVDNWHQIIEPARKDLATRIVIVGAESSGTTTLTEALHQHYAPAFPYMPEVPEYGRIFTENWLTSLKASIPSSSMDDLVWTAGDFQHIAKTQQMLEDSAVLASPLVIADTDVLATSIWEERYTDNTSSLLSAPLPRRDLYIITDHEGVEFDDDGFRDGEHLRAQMTRDFQYLLTKRNESWILATGSRERRLETAICVIDQIIAQNMTFTSPTWARKTVLS